VEGRVTGKIGPGFLVLAGFAPADTDASLEWMAEKILGLRVFGDAEGKMNRDLAETGGALLVVPQFTLYGDASKGRRPSFIGAAPPNLAIPLYEKFVALLREKSGGGKLPAVGSSFSDTGSAARSLAAERRDPVPAVVGSLTQALTRNGSATIAAGSNVNRIVMGTFIS